MATASIQRTTPASLFASRTLPAQPSTSSRRDGGMQGRIDLADLTRNNIGQLRKLNSALFPVRFSERWYKDVLEEDVKQVCKYALFNDIPVANVCCRFERAGSEKVRVYIMTLGCLAPYRRMGIATSLLAHVLEAAGPGKEVMLREEANTTNASNTTKPKANDEKNDGVPPRRRSFKVECVYLHVQTSNEEAKAFYEKNGFVVNDRVEDYYKVGISPRSAWLLERREA